MSGGERGTIGILTGGGDVPGLNPAIRAVTLRARREGYDVVGIRRGWGGLVDVVPDPEADNSAAVLELTNDPVIDNAATSKFAIEQISASDRSLISGAAASCVAVASTDSFSAVAAPGLSTRLPRTRKCSTD